MYDNDGRIVMTLDAGGTNLVFSALSGNGEVMEPIHLPSCPDDLDKCLNTLKFGFEEVKRKLPYPPSAISFAFPGPADYENGIIGDLPNFPSFRGGVALGPFLEKHFKIPVFINNDGNLFAYGEAISGGLPYVNGLLGSGRSAMRYNNLLGITLGTGFGAGVVIGGKLLTGDNGCGGDVWVFSNKKNPGMICEEDVSIRAVKRVYSELSGDRQHLTPKDIFDVAEGSKDGNREAAVQSFASLGEVAGDVISQAVTIVDGLVVIGGGLTGAAKYFMPALLKEMNGTAGTFAGDRFPRIQTRAYWLDDETDLKEFTRDKSIQVRVPQSECTVSYNPARQTGIMLSKLGTNNAIMTGAYSFAVNKLDNK